MTSGWEARELYTTKRRTVVSQAFVGVHAPADTGNGAGTSSGLIVVRLVAPAGSAYPVAMRLYQHPLSTFSRRVRMQLLEKGIAVEEVTLDMQKREHKSEAYLALNPYARVPTLVDGDFVLYESTAIMEYLEARFPKPPLVPSDAQGRAKVAMYLKLCDLEFAIHTRALFFPRRFVPRERWNVAEQDAAIELVARHLSILNRELEGKQYLVGNAYGLVEIAYTPFVEFLPVCEVEPPPNVARWIQMLQARPSAVATRPPK